MHRRARVRLVMLLLLAGCPATGDSFGGARTLPKGALRTGGVVRFAGAEGLPPIPQFGLSAMVAATDDVSIHGRALLTNFGVEAGARWRFLHAAPIHLAIAASGAASPWNKDTDRDDDYDGQRSANLMGRAFALATIELGQYDLNLGAFAGVSRIPGNPPPEGDAAPYAEVGYHLQGVVSVAGGSIGLALPIAHGWFRPAIEYMRFVERVRESGAIDPPFEPVDMITVSLGWER